jgi:SecD/SecF fusion protein
VTTSTVAAILTILGYSLYDVVIVFDRIRENAPRMPRAAFSQIVNRSMSDVLTRSLATSACTLMGVTALLLFGGETLKDFAFALLVGIASGTYSSIFIAAPVLTEWKEREPAFRQRRRRIEQELGYVPPYPVSATTREADEAPVKRERTTTRAARRKAAQEREAEPVATMELERDDAAGDMNGADGADGADGAVDEGAVDEPIEVEEPAAPVAADRDAQLRAERAARKKARAARQKSGRKHGRSR